MISQGGSDRQMMLRGGQLVGNSWFVLAGVTLKCLVSKRGDVAERLKAAVC